MIGFEDYAQPEFFRFGWDQLFLVQTVFEHSTHKEAGVLVELGAGSGVLSCELSKKMPIHHAHLVEFQQSEWEPYITQNVQKQGRLPSVKYHWQKVSEFNLQSEIQAQLLLCNPPYFLVRSGRASLDPRRNIAHRFVVDEYQAWIDAMVRSLGPGGEAWWLHRDPGPPGKPQVPEGFEVKHVKRSGRMRVIRLTRLNVE
jgi:tRNA1(Val) A37 N6-methylase TrmN6